MFGSTTSKLTGMSLDDKRTELLPIEKLGPVPKIALTADQHAKNNLPDILGRWHSFDSFTVSPSGGSASNGRPAKAGTPSPELTRPRTAQSFCVPKIDIAAQGYDLSLNRYKEVVHEEVAHRAPVEILKALGQLEVEIHQGMKELEGMLR